MLKNAEIGEKEKNLESTIYISSQQISTGNAAAQIFLINNKEDDYLISFSGNMKALDSHIKDMQIKEVLIYRGEDAKNIIDSLSRREQPRVDSDNHAFRNIKSNHEIRRLLIDWLFKSYVLESLV